MKTRLKGRTKASLLLGIAATITTIANASDHKVHSGTLCVDTANPTSVRYGTAFAFNSSTSNRVFICPVVKDGFGKIDNWNVTVNRNGATAVWPIAMASLNGAGDSGNTSLINVPNGNGVQQIFSNGGVNASGFSAGQMLLVSSITPPNARIHAYSVIETDSLF